MSAAGGGADVVEYALEKWGGHPHYRRVMHRLGEDEHGTWLWGNRGEVVYRGDEALFATRQDALLVVPHDEWWTTSWWLGHETIALYVNINTPALWDGDRVTAIDTDLDVVRFTDGRTEVVDRDEFVVHQLQYGYPADVIETTEAAAARALDLVLRDAAPFDGAAADAWIERARRYQ